MLPALSTDRVPPNVHDFDLQLVLFENARVLGNAEKHGFLAPAQTRESFTDCRTDQAVSDAVERLGVVIENLVNHPGLNLTFSFEYPQRADLGGGIVMTVVGTDDDVVFAGIFQDVR